MPFRVTQETLHGQVIYPDELPRRRGSLTKISSICVMSIIFAFCLTSSVAMEEIISFCFGFICYLSAGIAAECLSRMMFLPEESQQLKSRHNGSLWQLMKKLFFFPFGTCVYITACLCLFGAFILKYDVKHYVLQVSMYHLVAFVFIGRLLLNVVNLSRNSVADSVFMEGLKGLDYGSGMAQNFFYGYLQIVLPNTGDQDKGLRERIEDFIAKQRLPEELFPVKKLFVLIPSSSYLPNDLKDCSFGWMESAGNLEKRVKNRAGVIGRPYKNSVYRIKDPDDSSDKGVYVIAEGATPCKSFHEVLLQNDSYKDHQKEILFNFYETLRETLRENRDCRDLCEFIYYVDTDEFGLNNVNVALLILQRISEIQEKERFLKHVRDRNI